MAHPEEKSSLPQNMVQKREKAKEIHETSPPPSTPRMNRLGFLSGDTFQIVWKISFNDEQLPQMVKLYYTKIDTILPSLLGYI